MSDDMKNLLQETRQDLSDHHKTDADVVWVGSKDGAYAISWNTFADLAKDLVYDSGFGSQEIVDDLVVVGKDWWLERHEYDGHEWWEYKTLPMRQENYRAFASVVGRTDIADMVEEEEAESVPPPQAPAPKTTELPSTHPAQLQQDLLNMEEE